MIPFMTMLRVQKSWHRHLYKNSLNHCQNPRRQAIGAILEGVGQLMWLHKLQHLGAGSCALLQLSELGSSSSCSGSSTVETLLHKKVISDVGMRRCIQHFSLGVVVLYLYGRFVRACFWEEAWERATIRSSRLGNVWAGN